MSGTKRYQILDGTMLKILAMISMVLDHVGDLFFPGVTWLRAAGRLAMPIFAFCIAEGYAHTRDRKKYLLRMGLFALISEIPFDLAFESRIGLSHQNIMLTFFLSILALMLYDRIRGGKAAEGAQIPAWKTALGVLVPVLRAAAEAPAAAKRRGRSLSCAHQNGGLLQRHGTELSSPGPV